MLANDPATTCGASSSFNNAIGAHATIVHNIFQKDVTTMQKIIILEEVMQQNINYTTQIFRKMLQNLKVFTTFLNDVCKK
jgi:hypothetical protein